jgi:tRNA(fMet)-specific endonuclease VapC
MEYLLDTNICIYIIKRKPAEVIARFQSLPLGRIAISTITIAELEYGVSKSANPGRNKVALAQFLLPLAIAEFDSNAALHYGDVRSSLEKKGTIIGPLDMLIGAHARSLGLTLVTNNVQEFERIEALTVENWVV